MNEQHKDFDQLFNRHFADFKKDPPDNIWNGIKADLSQVPHGNIPHPIAGKTGLTLFSLTGLLLISLSLLYPGLHHVSNRKTARYLAFIKTDALNTTAIRHCNHDLVSGNTANHLSKDYDDNHTGTANNNTTSTVRNPAYLSALNASDNKISADNEQPPLTANPSSLKELTPVNNVEAFTVASDKPENNPASEHLLIQPPYANTMKDADNNIRIDNKSVQHPGIIFSHDVHTGKPHLNNASTQISNNFAGKFPVHNYRKRLNLNVGLKFTPEIAFNNGSSNTFAHYGGELDLGYKVGHWTIQTGVGLMFCTDRSNYQFQYKKYEATGKYNIVNSYTIDSIPLYSHDSLIGYTLRPVLHTHQVSIYDSVAHDETVSATTHYTILNIPVMVGYSWDIKRWSLSIKAGGVYSLTLSKSEQGVPRPDAEAASGEFDHQNAVHRQHQWSAIIIPGVDYNLTHNLSIGLEPYFRYTLSNENVAAKPAALKPYYWGMKAGITLNF